MDLSENQLVKYSSLLPAKLGSLHRGARKMRTAFEKRESEFRIESTERYKWVKRWNKVEY